MDNAIAKPPIHLWIVGGLAAVWNAFGCYDYTMTRMRDTDYLAKMMPKVDPQAILAWIDSFPIWAQFGWGLGVWMGLVGSLLLLVRHRWAVAAFGLSAVGAVVSLGYQMLGSTPPAGMGGTFEKLIPLVIIAIAIGLFLYARAMRIKGVLR